MSANRFVFASILILSLSLLALEITITRIASVVMYYHFSFLAISLALLGLGASGIVVYLFAEYFSFERFSSQAACACILYAIAALLAIAVLLSVQLDLQVSWAWLWSSAGLMFLIVVILLVLPFFFGGIAISLVLKHFSAQVSQLYFADLVGAGLGCLVVILSFDWLGGIDTVILVLGIGLIAAVLFAWFGNQRRLTAFAGAALGALIVLALWNGQTQWLRIRYPKGQVETTPVFEKWNAFSRVAVFPPNLLSKNFEPWDPDKGIPVDRMGIDIDAGAFTSIVQFDGNLEKVEYLRSDIAAVPYRLTPKQDVLVIGAGGGQDVLIALLHGSQKVTAVEINPIMETIVNERFGDFSGRLYQNPRVNFVMDEARSFIRHSEQQYDIIQATLVDTFAASSAGAFALSENYLYTREAFTDYWDHLKPNGILAMTRWYFEPPTEMYRLTAITLEALRARGIAQPEKHIIITRQDQRATFLLKKSEYSLQELEQIRAGEEEGFYEIVYAPEMGLDAEFVRQLAQPQEFVRAYSLDIQAPTDDRPFFFYFVKPSDNPLATLFNMFGGEGEPSTLLLTLFFILLVLAILWIGAPLFLFGKATSTLRAEWLVYFAGIGLGFILVEIALIQRFILFLGHPIYALAVILFALLFFGGVGSLLTGWIPETARARTHQIVLIALALLLLVYTYALQTLFNTFIGMPVAFRIVFSILLLVPLGLLMGMPFPLGIKLVTAHAPDLVPWMWGINGMFSVVGSVLAAIMAINFGLMVTLNLGLLSYILVLAATLYSTRKQAVALHAAS